MVRSPRASSSRSATTSTCMSSCRSARRPEGALLSALSVLDLRGYGTLEAQFGPGPQLVWGPNAAGKTSLLEAMVVLARGSSHRTTTDSDLIRWGADVARIEGHAGAEAVEVALVR